MGNSNGCVETTNGAVGWEHNGCVGNSSVRVVDSSGCVEDCCGCANDSSGCVGDSNECVGDNKCVIVVGVWERADGVWVMAVVV